MLDQVSPLVWVSWQPTPYNNLLFRSLAADPYIRLTVHFIAPVLPTHPWRSVTTSGFSARFFRTFCGIDWTLIGQSLRDKEHLFVVAGWHDLTMQMMLSILCLRRRPFVLWTDTPDTRQRRGFIKAAARSTWLYWVLCKATKVMGTGCTALNALHEMGCSRDRLVNLPYLVDFEKFTQRKRTLQDGIAIYGSSGRLAYEKGYDLALEALAKAYDGRLDSFRYRIAGLGPEKSALQLKAERLGIGHRVDFLGWLEPNELPDFYASIDVFLHPARYEPYGVAVLEAMAAGAIVIGSDTTGVILDRVQNGMSGFVHRSGSVSDLAFQIQQTCQHWDRMDEVRAAARAEAEKWPATRAVNLIASIAQEALS